jgi:hypothetical protein
MVDGKRQPMLLRLILFLIGENHEHRILPDLLRVQAAKVIVHKRFNCLVDVINYAFEFVVFVGVDL